MILKLELFHAKICVYCLSSGLSCSMKIIVYYLCSCSLFTASYTVKPWGGTSYKRTSSPQISHGGEVVDVDHGQLLLAGPLGLGRVTGTPWGQRGQVLIVRGAAGREICRGSAESLKSKVLTFSH